MKKALAIAGVIALALTAGGCSFQTIKDWFKQNAPAVACKAAEKEYAKWVAAGKPINFGGRDEGSLIRVLSDAGYAEVKQYCASKGITIN